MKLFGWRGLSWIGVAFVAATFATSGAVRAQDDLDDDDPAEANGLGMVVIGQQPGIEQFEQWVFNRMGGAGIARNRLNAALELHIDEINRVCGINDAQKKKLQLAGRGDIKRFFDRVEEAKRRYLLVMNEQNHNIWEDIQPLQSALNSGIFVDESIFAKTVKNTLSAEQAARLAEVVEHRNKTRYAITIDWFVTHIDKGLGLSAEQRRRLADVLKDTRPPRRFGTSDYYFLLYRASQIPEDRIKPIFDNIQWRIFSMQLNQGRGMQQWLKNNGMIDAEPALADEERRLAEAARRAAVARKAIKAAAGKKVEKDQKK